MNKCDLTDRLYVCEARTLVREYIEKQLDSMEVLGRVVWTMKFKDSNERDYAVLYLKMRGFTPRYCAFEDGGHGIRLSLI